MRFIYPILFVVISVKASAQTETVYLNYDPFFEDSTLAEHTVVKPVLIKRTEKTGYDIIHNGRSKTEYLRLYPAINAVGAFVGHEAEDYLSYRLQSGIGFETNISGKFHLRGNVLAGYSEINANEEGRNTLIQNTYFYNPSGVNAVEVQPRIRASYQANKFFNLQAGIDQQFIGEGRRSLLMSDYAAPHPFFQLRTQFWKIQFVNLYQFFRENIGGSVIHKYASTHLLNFQCTKRFQIGLYESVLFSPKDSLLNRGYEIEYLNPFLFYRPTEYSIGSQDRLVLGINLSYRFDNLMIYGQFLFDDFVLNELVNRTRWWANKYSGQIGIKGKERFSRTTFRYITELNFARPFTYTHLGLSTNYGHQGMSLTHPLGANFVEVYNEFSLHLENSLTIQLYLQFIQQGGEDANSTTSYGADVYEPYTLKPFDYGYRIGGNGKINRTRIMLELNAPLLKKSAMIAFLRGGIEASQRGDKTVQMIPIIYTGIRTNLWNDRSFTF
ncbi:MAG: hypothetical protein R3277_11175 [Brumimicrobium sp.]|nr:hypothetical protein [Brumimicrobium sp.]